MKELEPELARPPLNGTSVDLVVVRGCCFQPYQAGLFPSRDLRRSKILCLGVLTTPNNSALEANK